MCSPHKKSAGVAILWVEKNLKKKIEKKHRKSSRRTTTQRQNEQMGEDSQRASESANRPSKHCNTQAITLSVRQCSASEPLSRWGPQNLLHLLRCPCDVVAVLSPTIQPGSLAISAIRFSFCFWHGSGKTVNVHFLFSFSFPWTLRGFVCFTLFCLFAGHLTN